MHNFFSLFALTAHTCFTHIIAKYACVAAAAAAAALLFFRLFHDAVVYILYALEIQVAVAVKILVLLERCESM